MRSDKNRVCPVELANSLDSGIRRWLQNPRKILAPFVREGMTVLDVGCGPGFFSVEMAKMVGNGGKVVAADLQEGMLEKLREKIRGTELEARFRLVKCDPDRINVLDRVDFILTFYMVHEVPDQRALFRQFHELLDDQGAWLLVEPKLFHVSREEFEASTRLAQEIGFEVRPGPRLLASWSAVLTKPPRQSRRRAASGRV
jgi:ubiquinone/menaquinone biosynthesis C-methylase UbiE